MAVLWYRHLNGAVPLPGHPAAADPWQCMAHRGEDCMLPSMSTASVSFSEMMMHATSAHAVVMDVDDMSWSEKALLDTLEADYSIPEVLEGISLHRVFSFGGAEGGVEMSQHDSAWLATVAGIKLWHLAPPHVPKPAHRTCAHRGMIDWAAAALDGVRHCAVLPGEVMVVPSMWWHATCNLMPYTVAMGGQVTVNDIEKFSYRSERSGRSAAPTATLSGALRRCCDGAATCDNAPNGSG